MESETIQKSVPNIPLEGIPEELPDDFFKETEEEIPISSQNNSQEEEDKITIDGGDKEEIELEVPINLKSIKGKKVKKTPKIKDKNQTKQNLKQKQILNPILEFKGNDFQMEALETHNELRKRHHVDELILDKELCLISQKYAKKLASKDLFEHSNNKFKGKPIGENLYCCMGMPCTGKGMSESWYSEIKYYNFDKPGWKDNTGHFTQVIWKGSKRVGFGFAKSITGWYYGVASYFPAGNYLNSFLENVMNI